ncbi:GroES-like protein [Xylariaceae sp. FL0662B]|nr:GroES-like protein [Xylariaceae sp. FL0662B]
MTLQTCPEGAPSQLPSSQSAIIQNSFGFPILTHEADIPILLPGTLLVKTRAVALNPSDTKMGATFPSPGAIIGTDFAGEIVQIHPEAGRLRLDLNVGDMVCGLVHGSNPANHGNGAFAEYLRIPAQLVIKVPKGMEMHQASSLGVAIATNCIALWESLGIPASPDEPALQPFDVLVYGGSTCVGTMAMQMLKLSGARVITTCSPKNFAMVKRYGADDVFDYTSSDTPESIRKLTGNRLRYALDCITDHDSVACCYAALGRSGGRYVCLELCPEELKTRKAVKCEFIMVLEIFGERVQLDKGYGRDPNPGRYKTAVRWFEIFQRLLGEGKIIPHPTQVLNEGLQGVIDGLNLLKTGSISGKKLVAYVP